MTSFIKVTILKLTGQTYGIQQNCTIIEMKIKLFIILACKNKKNFKQSHQWLNFFLKLLPEMKKRNNCWCEIYEVAIK